MHLEYSNFLKFKLIEKQYQKHIEIQLKTSQFSLLNKTRDANGKNNVVAENNYL